ncbi:MAG: 3-deoxy-D-manno-octulosonate 8-phosphate phosphatase [Rikenellaceae bacterium]|nr:3-deoxy-D-manno-octulosonate 8-phosphate phosphatase [Rikenellaceae bacterium]
MGNFKEDIAKVRAFVFDVDGVFTDGGIIPTPDGDFIRKYNTKDGYAVAYALKAGYDICIITGGRGRSLELRFKLLGVTEYHDNCPDKLSVMKDFMERRGLAPDQVLFMGDDIPDLEAMQCCSLPVCPADACTEVLEISRYVSQFDGGRGCIRDVIEQVLRSQGKWARDSYGVTTVPSA